MTTMMTYGGIAIYGAALLCGVVALFRVLLSTERQKALSITMFIPAIALFTYLCGAYGWNLKEVRENFLFKYDLRPPASLDIIMSILIVLQLVILLLATFLLMRKQVNTTNRVLLRLTAILIFALLILDYVYFYFIYRVDLSVIAGFCYLILLFVLCNVHTGLLTPKLTKWFPVVYLILSLSYAAITVDYGNFIDFATAKMYLVYSPFILPIYLTALYYLIERRDKKRQALPT